jgi:hypothetical protein
MPDVKVIKIAQVNGVDDQGRAQLQIQLTYTVNGHGPFTHNFPKDGFNGLKAQAALQEFAREVTALPV